MSLENSNFGRALVELAMADGGITSEEADAMSLLGAGPGSSRVTPTYRAKPFRTLSASEAQLVFEELAFVVACDGDVAITEELTLRSLGDELSLPPEWVSMALRATHQLADAIRVGGADAPQATDSAAAAQARRPMASPVGDPSEPRVSPVAALAQWTREAVGEFGGTALSAGAAAAGGAAAGAAASSIAYAGLSGALLKGAVFFTLAPTPAIVVAAPVLGAAAATVASRRLAKFWRTQNR